MKKIWTEEEYEEVKKAGIDLKSFHEHGLDLLNVDDKGTFRVVKLERDK